MIRASVPNFAPRVVWLIRASANNSNPKGRRVLISRNLQSAHAISQSNGEPETCSRLMLSMLPTILQLHSA